ncbi:hypothetical protein Droror1_Dr00027813 [Drosera rotundifolia]
MKSLGKLKRLAFRKNEGTNKREFLLPSKLDDLAQASKEMEDMKNCYDGLLSAAAATTNSAFEFSLSLREMGDCLCEKATLYHDKESGKVLTMLGQLQFELQKLVDRYRSHIVLTITNPSESLLKELQTVEEMKQQCNEKRSVYEYMMEQQSEMSRSKSGKGESFTLQDLKLAYTQYEEEATLCGFRLKSLKEGQSRSLLTQAARHHTAQLNFFRRAFKSLEAVDPHVKQVTEKHHIDYQVSGLDDADDDDGETTYDSQDYGELSFDQHQPGGEVVSISRNSMEVDQEDKSFPKGSTSGSTELMETERRVISHSAPILAEKKFDPADRVRQLRPPVQKYHAHILPTPVASTSSDSRTSSVPRIRPNVGGQNTNIWFSSPLETKLHKRDPKKDSSAAVSGTVSVYYERSSNEAFSHLPPLPDAQSFRLSDTLDASDHKKMKRYAFSGPLTGNDQSIKPGSASGAPVPLEFSKLETSSVSQSLLPQQPSASKVSPNASPTLSPPRLTELYELPRPPSTVSRSVMISGSIGHSAPLVPRNAEPSITHRNLAVVSNSASPLPAPPLALPRSFSIPSRRRTTASLEVSKLVESSGPPEKNDSTSSPPLTPISLLKS